MKTNIILLTAISFGFCLNSYSQTSPKKNTLEFSTGYNSGALKNLEIAPVSRYDYNGLIYKLGYRRTSKKQNLFNIQLDYLESELKSDLIPVLNLDYTKIDLNISYLKQVYSKNKFSFHLGLKSYSNISSYSKNNEFRAIINQSFGVASQSSYQINEKHSLSSKLAMPFILLRATHGDSGIYSLKKYQSVSWNIGYNYSLSNRLDAIATYDFNYDRLQITSAFREVQYQLNVGLNFKF